MNNKIHAKMTANAIFLLIQYISYFEGEREGEENPAPRPVEQDEVLPHRTFLLTRRGILH
jgi:hypothetical protein